MNTQPICPSTGKLASRSRVTVRRKMASLRVCTQRRQFRPGANARILATTVDGQRNRTENKQNVRNVIGGAI
jgi:hypothetical protein